MTKAERKRTVDQASTHERRNGEGCINLIQIPCLLIDINVSIKKTAAMPCGNKLSKQRE